MDGAGWTFAIEWAACLYRICAKLQDTISKNPAIFWVSVPLQQVDRIPTWPNKLKMKKSNGSRIHHLLVFTALILMPVVVWGQHPVLQLEGYWLTLTSEGHPGTMEQTGMVIRSEQAHDFFLPTMDVPWDKMGAYSCFYQLGVKEINDLYVGQYHNPNPISRGEMGNYWVDTTRLGDISKLLRAKNDQWNLSARPDDAKHLALSLRARVDVYQCRIWVLYLEDHGYGDCDGKLRMIPQYGLIKHPDNRKEYLYSVVLPVLMKLPRPYRAYEN